MINIEVKIRTLNNLQSISLFIEVNIKAYI